jgi:hypothetical protein
MHLYLKGAHLLRSGVLYPDRTVPEIRGVSARDRETEPRILLITTCHLPSTARLALAIAEAGASVAAACPPIHPLVSTGVAQPLLHYGAVSPIHSLEAAIRRVGPDLIVPGDERAVRHLHAVHSRTTSADTRCLVERSLGNPANYPLIHSRHEVLMLAREVGVRVPDSVAIRSPDDLRDLAAAQPLPWVLKADGSWSGFGVRTVASLEQAENIFRKMNRPVTTRLALRETLLERDHFWWAGWMARTRPAISAQAFIDGRPANCAVVCRAGEVLAGIAVEVVTTEFDNGPSTVIRVVDHREMLQAASRVVAALGMSGLVGFDFMIERGSGAAFMIEMNPRATPICHMRLGVGRDLVEALVADAGGRPMRKRPAVTDKDIIALFPQTWKRDPMSRFLHDAYHDVPWEAPDLVRVLVRPEMRERYWATRLLRRIWHKVR